MYSICIVYVTCSSIRVAVGSLADESILIFLMLIIVYRVYEIFYSLSHSLSVSQKHTQTQTLSIALPISLSLHSLSTLCPLSFFLSFFLSLSIHSLSIYLSLLLSLEMEKGGWFSQRCPFPTQAMYSTVQYSVMYSSG